MKMFYNMSARDRSLLILLLAVVIFYLSYTFVISPSLEKAEILKTNLTAVQDEMVRANQLIEDVDQLKSKEENQREDLIKKYSVFFFDLDQSRLLNKMDSLTTEAGIPVVSYIATPELAAPVLVEKGVFVPQQYPLKDLAMQINPELMTESQNETGNEEAAPADPENASDLVLGTDISISFSGASYEGFYNFMNLVEQMNKTVVLKSINLTKGETGLDGQMVFAFYSIPKLDPEQKDGLDFTPVLPKGKANPFI